MNIYFYKIPDSSDSHYRGIGFYSAYLTQALKDLGCSIKYFTDEKDIKEGSKTIVHYPWLHPYFLTAPLSKKYKRVITVHDLIPLKFPKLYPPGLRAKLVWKINQRITKQADAVITDSLTSKNDILRFCWSMEADKVKVIPLAVDAIFKPLKNPRLSPSLAKKLNNVASSFVLYVGDVNPSKNLPTLIKSCLELKIPLVLVGNKFIQKDYDEKHPENKDLVFVQKMVKKHPKLIILTGFIDKKDLLSLYNLAKIYCQPSLEEGFGLPVLEAMSSGCPVAVSQTSALIEITKTNAALFDPNSLSSLKNTLKELINNEKKRDEVSDLGLKRAKQYSWQKTAKETLAVYQKILDNN